jgi:hypothetical protein
MLKRGVRVEVSDRHNHMLAGKLAAVVHACMPACVLHA